MGDYMGGRGSSSGMSKYGKSYGSQYHSLLTVGNIRFVEKSSKQSETLMETMTKGRVYALIDQGKVKSIYYFDKHNKRSKQIDMTNHHGKSPHVHHGYEHNEYSSGNEPVGLTLKERAMVDRVLKMWENNKRK